LDRRGDEVAEEDEMGGASNTNGEKRNAYRLLAGKHRRKEAIRKTKT
jgi:hypothetical protein